MKKNIKFIFSSILKFIILMAISVILGIILTKVIKNDLLIAVISTIGGFIISILIFRKKLSKDMFQRIDVESWKNIGKFIILYFLVLIITAIILPPKAVQQTLELISQNKILYIVFPLIIAPIQEEIYFRYIMLRDEEANDLVKIITSGILFGLIHLQNSGDFNTDFRIILVTSILGMFSATIFYKNKYKNLTPSIFFHFLINLLPIVLGLVVKG